MNNHLKDEQLIKYVTRTLTDSQREIMDSHLAACQTCRVCLADHEALQRRIRYSLIAKRKQFSASSQMTFSSLAPRLKKARRRDAFWQQSVHFVAVAATIVLLVIVTHRMISWRSIDQTSPSQTAGIFSTLMRILIPEPSSDYILLSLAQVSGRDTVEENNLWLLPGVQTLPARPNIPFEIGWTTTTQCHNTRLHKTKIQMEGFNISSPREVYLLLQGGWALKRYEGKEIGEVVLVFANGRSLKTPLKLGENIRDWSIDEAAAVKIAPSRQLQEVWVGQSKDGTVRGRIDMLTIKIPDEYQQMSLTNIQVVDHSTEIWSTGSIDPCIHLLAITVKYR